MELTKPVNEKQLFAAIRFAFAKECIARRERAEVIDALTCFNTLTPRQREALKQIVTGKPNKQIATHLGIDLHTLKAHRAVVMEKMKTNSLADLVRVALHIGIDEQRSLHRKMTTTPVGDFCTSTRYEIRPRKDRRGVDLITDVLRFGGLWYGEPNAVTNESAT